MLRPKPLCELPVEMDRAAMRDFLHGEDVKAVLTPEENEAWGPFLEHVIDTVFEHYGNPPAIVTVQALVTLKQVVQAARAPCAGEA